MKRCVMQIVLWVSLGYVGLMGGMYGFQRQLMYAPEKRQESPKEFNLPMRNVVFKAADNVQLAAWYAKAPEGQPTIIYYHGNAGRLGSRPGKLRTLMAENFGMLALSYRGFGGSEGMPTEAGIYEDARAAIRYLNEQGVKQEQIVLYGESLGTGVAVQMATEFPRLKAVVLEAPYTSTANRGQEIYPYVPVKLLMKDRFDSISKIGGLAMPLLFLHGYEDRTIPLAHSRALIEKVKAPHKAHFFEGIGHSDFPLEEVARKVRRFVDSKGTKI